MDLWEDLFSTKGVWSSFYVWQLFTVLLHVRVGVKYGQFLSKNAEIFLVLGLSPMPA